jgi:hypothetical protein
MDLLLGDWDNSGPMAGSHRLVAGTSHKDQVAPSWSVAVADTMDMLLVEVVRMEPMRIEVDLAFKEPRRIEVKFAFEKHSHMH